MTLRLEVYGRMMVVTRHEDGWQAFHVGGDGKRRPAHDVLLPPELEEDQIPGYVADLLHEWATAKHPRVERLG